MGLQHDRILKCLGMFTRDRHLYLVSPFMRNGSLFDWIRFEGHVGVQRLRLVRRSIIVRSHPWTDGIPKDL